MYGDRFEFKRDPDNGLMVGPDGCHYDSEAQAMYYSCFASCGCGNPEKVHKLLVDCAKQFEGQFPKPGVAAIEQIIRERADVVAELIGHYLSGEHFLEHGVSVYGSWLTERGKQFIEIGPLPEDEAGDD